MHTEFHIGIDDTDSRIAGCTTYTAAILFQELASKGFEPMDYPWLIRLNPNVPWKTRGNGALSLHFRIDDESLPEARAISLAVVGRFSDFTQRSTDPAVVFLTGAVPIALREFASRALHDLISIPEARHVASEAGVETHLLKGSRGLVGALASIGADLQLDHTFEIIAYRNPENIGMHRRVSHDSILQMDKVFRRLTFNNVDPETGRVLVCPHGPDPVLIGIRGEDPDSLTRALGQIDIDEPIERSMIFKSNQGTDAHLKSVQTISTVRRHQSVVIRGAVQATRMIRGGHVIFRIDDQTGSIDCAAYRATGSLRDTALQLVPGDLVTVSGGVHQFKGNLAANVEKLEVTGLSEIVRFANPHCMVCGARCESMGMFQGFRCKKCKMRFPRASQVRKPVPRKIGLGVFLPPPRAHRHLTKPVSRYRIYDHNVLKAGNSNADQTIGPPVSVSISL